MQHERRPIWVQLYSVAGSSLRAIVIHDPIWRHTNPYPIDTSSSSQERDVANKEEDDEDANALHAQSKAAPPKPPTPPPDP